MLSAPSEGGYRDVVIDPSENSEGSGPYEAGHEGHPPH